MCGRIVENLHSKTGPIHTESGNTYYGYHAGSSDSLGFEGFARTDLSDTCVARFHQKYKKSDTGCWLWQASLFAKGYGQVFLRREPDGRPVNGYAHRVAYVLAKGPIPAGLVVMHKCDTPACVNPDHLTLGTQAENLRDATEKGRYPRTGPNLWQRKLSDGDVIAIRMSFAKSKDLARAYGVQPSLISAIRNGKRRQLATAA